MHSTVFPWLLLDGVLRDVVVTVLGLVGGRVVRRRCLLGIPSVLQTASSAAQPSAVSSHLLGATAARPIITGYCSPEFSLAQLLSSAFGSYVLLWHLPERHYIIGCLADAAPKSWGQHKKE